MWSGVPKSLTGSARAWELGAGGLAALLETKVLFRNFLTIKIRTGLGIVGLVAVLVSVFEFTSDTPFPGIAALLPVLGAIFLLVSGIGSLTIVGQILSLPIIVRIGLISYPLYLWHWPITSLLRQLKIDPTQPIYAFAIVLLTIALAEMTYRYVELPIRQRRFLPTTGKLLVPVGLGFFILACFGLHSWHTDGAAYRYSAAARSLLTAPFLARSDRCGFVFKVLHPQSPVCELQKSTNAQRRVLLWGNSHADMWSGMFLALSKENNADFFLTARNCRATMDSDFCGSKTQSSVLGFITSKKITDVVLASTWYGSYDISDDVFEKQLRDVVVKLSNLGVKIWLVIDVPENDELSPIVAYEKNPSNPKLGAILRSEYAPVIDPQIQFRSATPNGGLV